MSDEVRIQRDDEWPVVPEPVVPAAQTTSLEERLRDVPFANFDVTDEEIVEFVRESRERRYG